MEQRLNTDGLTELFSGASPEELESLLAQNSRELITEEKPFARYLRTVLENHGITQKACIEKAGFSLKYGYRLLSEERHTRQRDYILRLCLAGHFTLDETQRLLKLYGMSSLYPRLPRDGVLITLFGSGIDSPEDANRILREHSFPELKTGED